MIDANEMEGAGLGAENTTRGWSAYLTLHSKENNTQPNGEPRINLNTEDMQALHDSLSLVFPDDWVKFIVAYRQNGEYTENETGEPYSGGELDLSQPGKKEAQLKQVLDLIGKKVRVKFQGDEENTVLQSPFAEDLVSMSLYMTTLVDHVTVVDTTIPGRININQAPREILAGIPGISEDVVEQIISSRPVDPSEADPSFLHETWILTQGIVTLEEMRSLTPMICGGGDVYRMQVVGYYDDGGASARLEVVLDATQLPPRVLLWRDISHLGRGHALETLGAALGSTAME
jgi:DNA uptake protein ComE-like DNA-binding protein